MSRTALFWGIILILVGILLLLDNLGLLPTSAWQIIWPLALVALGAWIMWRAFGRQPTPSPLEERHIAIPLEGTERAHLRIQHGAGRLQVSAGAEPGHLLTGDVASGIDSSSRKEGITLRVNLRGRVDGIPWFPWFEGRSPLDWDLRLTDSIPLAIELETGASDSQLDLTDVRVIDLTLRTGASATRLTLPALAGTTRVDIHSGAASVAVRVPDGVEARIKVRGGLSGVSVNRRRFARTNGTYQSSGYAQATNRVDIDAEVGVGSLDIR